MFTVLVSRGQWERDLEENSSHVSVKRVSRMTKAYFKISLSTTILAYFIKKGYHSILKNYNHIFVAVGIELRALNILGSILPLGHIASPGITVKEACAKEITW